MYSREEYKINPQGVVQVLENIATMCLAPDQDKRFTVLGYSKGVSGEPPKALVPYEPSEHDNYMPYVTGQNNMFLVA